MNKIRLVFPRFNRALMTMLLIVSTPAAYAVDKDCWADFFEHAEYEGKHFLIAGPASLENLNKVNGEDWNLRIHSFKVGPKAKVTVYQNPKFQLNLPQLVVKDPDLMRAWGITEQDIKEDAELIFNENATVHDLGDFNFHKKVRSLKVECI
jgi:hypothetical protein